MAPFGDGGVMCPPSDEGEEDARWGWDPLRSGSAPPTMDGASAAALLAANGVLAGGCGAGGGSFFSGAGGLGARLNEVGRQHGIVGQDHFGNSALLSKGLADIRLNGSGNFDGQKFGPSRVHSVDAMTDHLPFDMGPTWAEQDAEFRSHPNHFLSNMGKMNTFGRRDLDSAYLSDSDLSDTFSGLGLSNRTPFDERSHEKELFTEMLMHQRDFNSNMADDSRSPSAGNIFRAPRSEHFDFRSPRGNVLRRQNSSFDGPNDPRMNHHHMNNLVLTFELYCSQFFEFATESQLSQLADKLSGHILNLSCQMYGCRVVQKVIEVVDMDRKIDIVNELKNSVLKCINDQNGNHVIQKCIECVPEDRIPFVIEPILAQICMLCTHQYGCRVIQRVLEHCHDPATQSAVMDEIVQHACGLTEDKYGNYVVQHVLQHGKPEERSSIIQKLSGQVVILSQQKYASNVVEKCLAFGTPDERDGFISEIVSCGQTFQALMKDQFGNYVVQKVLQTCDDKYLEMILSSIKVHLNELKNYTYGKHIVARVEKLIVTGENRVRMVTKTCQCQQKCADIDAKSF
uniref:Uncharacterized protein n=1 Tax=Avena sativa TaxID=4498 RepID=A0ACD5WMP6_AVESA